MRRTLLSSFVVILLSISFSGSFKLQQCPIPRRSQLQMANGNDKKVVHAAAIALSYFLSYSAPAVANVGEGGCL